MCVLNFRDIKIRILCCLNNEKKEKKNIVENFVENNK